MDDDEDFLAAVEADNAGTPVAEAPPEKVEAEAAPEPVKEPEAPVEPQPAAEPVLELTEPAPGQPKPEPGFVPLAAMLDARDRAKAAEAELARLRDQAQQAQQPVPMPDPFEDPEGYAAAQEAKFGQALYQMNLRNSERLNTIQHGAEKVQAAKQWGYDRCNTDPYFNAKVASSEDPIGFVMAEYQREEIASKVTPDEFAQFQAWKQAQSQLQPGGKPPTPTQTSAIPPPSLASAPSAGSILTEPEQSDEEIFSEVIGKR